MTIISFKKNEHDSFLDFIKAYAILGVLVCHTVFFINKVPGYGLFFGIDVPLFVLMQVFHFYKKQTTLSFRKIFNRIFLPFFVVQFVMILIQWFVTKECDIIKGLKGFGFGPGSYYPLIYFQIALLLPLFKLLFNRLSKTQALIVFLCIAEGLEIVCSLLKPSEGLYRLLVFRYVFLIYLGYLWVVEGVVINGKMILLSILSALAVIYFVFISDNNEPLFFTSGWKAAKWPCYYWLSHGLISVLWFLWKLFQRSKIINKCVTFLAKSSWEIFLCQMASIFLINLSMINVNNRYLRYVIWMIIIWVISIGGGIVLNKVYSQILYRERSVQKIN